MRRARQIGLGILVLLLLVVVAGSAYGVALVRRPFPQTDGTLTVAGLGDEVHIYRDDFGIPHIYAGTTEDLFFAQGYVHAQDRFWQMEFWRHVSAGRLAEIAGEPLVESDKFIRTMGWNRLAKETLAYYESNEPEMMTVLDAYSAGVNAYIEANRGHLSFNLSVLQLVNKPWEVEPWTPLDTVGWGIVMSDDLSGNWEDELQRGELTAALGEEMANALMPLYPANRPVIVPLEPLTPTTRLEGGATVAWERVNRSIVGEVPATGWALGADEFVGSNNWVIHGDHTDTGMPLLADDPHLSIQMPSIWYEIGLHAPGWDVTGFSFAGVPGVILGHNERIAWGVTNGTVDVQDLFIERVNPDNPRQYEFMGEWRDMTVIEETIRVNGGDPVTLEVLETHHGPIISDLVDGASDVIAFRWTAQEPSRLLKSVLEMNRAQNFDEFRAALRYWDVPAQNFVYADVDGNIGYQLPGLIPVRRAGDGLLPVPGWTGEYEWEGWVPYGDMPTRFNPPEGYIVTANNAVVDENYPYILEQAWDNGDRAQRITDLIEQTLDEQGQISAEDIARIHMDSYSLLAASYQPLLAGLSSDDPDVQAALEQLQGWDGQLRRDSVPAALWELFYYHLAPATLGDELGEMAEDYLGNSSPQRVLFHRLATQPDAAWWDDTTTPATETRDAILLQALAETVAWFNENVGGEMETWQWGKLHTATFVSNPLGQSGVGPLEDFVNRGPFPVDGGSSAVNANGWSWSSPAAVRGHVSMRMIVDLADFERSQAVHSTGQSGHPSHPHYLDMFDLWQNGRYHPMLWGRERVEAEAADHLILQPR